MMMTIIRIKPPAPAAIGIIKLVLWVSGVLLPPDGEVVLSLVLGVDGKGVVVGRSVIISDSVVIDVDVA